MARDVLSSLKTLLAQLQEGERNASDLVKGLNTWAREIGDLIKDKVEEEVERSVKKMGFVKREQFAALEARVKFLEKSLAKSPQRSTKARAVTTNKGKPKKVQSKSNKEVKKSAKAGRK